MAWLHIRTGDPLRRPRWPYVVKRESDMGRDLVAYMAGGERGYAKNPCGIGAHGDIGAGVGVAVGSRGAVANFSGSATNEHVDWDKARTPSIVEQDFVVGGWQIMASPGATAMRFWNDRGTGATGTAGVAVMWNGSSWQFSTVSENASNYLQFAAGNNSTAPFGKVAHFVMLWRQSAQELTLWANGELMHTASAGVGTPTDMTTTRPWRLGAASNSTTTHRLNALLWNQYLFRGAGYSADTVRKLYSEPYHFIEEYGRTRYFVPAAPVGGGTVAPKLYHHRHHNLAA